MENNIDLSNSQQEVKMEVDDPEASTSAVSHGPVIENVAGLTGSSCSPSFQQSAVMWLLLNLKEREKEEISFVHTIVMNQNGYGKFENFVLRFYKTGGKCIRIHVQCIDCSQTENVVSAEDLFSVGDKPFSLVEHFKNYVDTCITESEGDDETYYMILTNAVYNDENDCNYPCFQRESIADTIDEKTMLYMDKNGIQIKYNSALSDFMLKLGIDSNEKYIEQFCNNFLFVSDS